MTEPEILAVLSESIDRTWYVQQWWVSISFGLLVLAHLASEKLNAVLLLTVIGLYTTFTFYIFSLLKLNYGVTNAYKKDLESLLESGVDLMNGTSFWVQQNTQIANNLGQITFLSTFICVISYLVYGYWKSRRGKTLNNK